jgi:hypothetical protein
MCIIVNCDYCLLIFVIIFLCDRGLLLARKLLKFLVVKLKSSLESLTLNTLTWLTVKKVKHATPRNT